MTGLSRDTARFLLASHIESTSDVPTRHRSHAASVIYAVAILICAATLFVFGAN